jgi:hypothetical protein
MPNVIYFWTMTMQRATPFTVVKFNIIAAWDAQTVTVRFFRNGNASPVQELSVSLSTTVPTEVEGFVSDVNRMTISNSVNSQISIDNLSYY